MNEINFAGQNSAPSKIACIGRNYAKHISELGNSVPSEMVFFFKPNSSITSELHAEAGEPLHYEVELCLGIEDGELRYVGAGLDLTKRDLQTKLKGKGLPWERCKSFIGSAVFTDFVRLEERIAELEVELLIDGNCVQSGSVTDMINKPEDILRELETFTAFEDFDILMTGTPHGVGVVKRGSTYEATVKLAGEKLVSRTWVAV